MATDKEQFQGPSSESRQAGYETSDVSIKGLAIFVVSLVVLAAIIHAGVWFLFGGYVRSDESKDRPHSALTDEQYVKNYNREHGTELSANSLLLPPAPRIQPTLGAEKQNTPDADLQQMYGQEDAFFKRMGWIVDDQTHVQTAIPESVVRSVISDETRRQRQETSAKGSPTDGSR